jgi:hypothetical protein
MSSGMRRHVALVRTDVWEERIAFIILVDKVSELGALAVIILLTFLARSPLSS